MSAAIHELLFRLGARIGSAESLSRSPAALRLDWPELDAALPDGGLPRGVIELAAPDALGGGTSIVRAAMRAAHARDSRAWCAWIDPESTLYAPGVSAAGVALSRLLVVHPPRRDLARVVVKVAASGAFDVIAIDMSPVPGTLAENGPRRAVSSRQREWPADVLVRKLALLAADTGASILLLTDSTAPRAQAWPVALRLEIAREPAAITLRVAKDRRGRVGLAKTVPLTTRPGLTRAG